MARKKETEVQPKRNIARAVKAARKPKALPPAKAEKPANVKSELPVVKKKPTKRAVMLVLAGALIVLGLVCFFLYAQSMNMLTGGLGVLVGVGGGVLFFIFWGQSGERIIIEAVGDVPKEQVNCINLYRDRVVFENYCPEGAKSPPGFPRECLNDHKRYWLNISDYDWSQDRAGLHPFKLPDHQFFDPTLFAERVLMLPCNRKVMKRKEKLSGVIKTALLVVTILILFILITVTTGNKSESASLLPILISKLSAISIFI